MQDRPTRPEPPRQATIEELKLAAPLAFWPDEALCRLAPVTTVRWHEAGEVLARAWEPATAMWVVMKGCLELTRTSASGRRYLSDILAPYSVAGITPALDGRDTLFDTRVRVASQVMAIPCRELSAEIEADARLGMATIKLISLRQRLEHDRAVMNCVDPVKVRVAKAVLYLGRSPGLLEGSAATLPMPVTYEDIADFLGLSQSAVTREIRELIAAGALAKQYRAVVIASIQRLTEIARAPAPFNKTAQEFLSRLPRG